MRRTTSTKGTGPGCTYSFDFSSAMVVEERGGKRRSSSRSLYLCVVAIDSAENDVHTDDALKRLIGRSAETCRDGPGRGRKGTGEGGTWPLGQGFGRRMAVRPPPPCPTSKLPRCYLRNSRSDGSGGTYEI